MLLEIRHNALGALCQLAGARYACYGPQPTLLFLPPCMHCFACFFPYFLVAYEVNFQSAQTPACAACAVPRQPQFNPPAHVPSIAVLPAWWSLSRD